MESYYRIRLPRKRSAMRQERIYERHHQRKINASKKRRPSKMDELRKRLAKLAIDLNLYGPPFLMFALIVVMAIAGRVCSRVAGR